MSRILIRGCYGFTSFRSTSSLLFFLCLLHLSLVFDLFSHFSHPNEPFLESVSLKTSSIPFHSSTHHLSEAPFSLIPYSQFLELPSPQLLKLKTLQLPSALTLLYQVDHSGWWPIELHFITFSPIQVLVQTLSTNTLK